MGSPVNTNGCLLVVLVLTFAIIGAIVYFGGGAIRRAEDRCAAAGGVLVRTYEGPACIRAERIELPEDR